MKITILPKVCPCCCQTHYVPFADGEDSVEVDCGFAILIAKKENWTMTRESQLPYDILLESSIALKNGFHGIQAAA